MVPLVLLFYIPDGIKRTPFVTLVDHDNIGKIEHVDLLKLACCTVFRRHYIHRKVAVVDDLCVGLANARRLDHHKVKSRRLEDDRCVFYISGKRKIRLPGSQGPHENPGVENSVHADAVSKQSPAGLSFCRVD